MTVSSQDTIQQEKPSDKEINFRNLEAKYQAQLEKERQARMEAERRYEESRKYVPAPPANDEDDDDSEPYVDHKKLNKKLAKFGETTKAQTQSEIQNAVQIALREERKQNWIKQHGDFYDVLKHAEKLALQSPDLAESILEMPEGFERQKLVYKNIKALGLHEETKKAPSIQDKIDANKRSPYYQPSGVGTAPYASVGDYSEAGQKQAYAKLQELKKNLRI